MQQRWALLNSRNSLGVTPTQNTAKGRTQWYWETFNPCVNRLAHQAVGAVLKSVGRRMGPVVFGAAGRSTAAAAARRTASVWVSRKRSFDVFFGNTARVLSRRYISEKYRSLPAPNPNRSLCPEVILRAALETQNMTETGKLQGFVAILEGMCVKVTMKLLPPELVQEATAEALAIGPGFHEREQFGLPQRRQAAGCPPDSSHTCWQGGWIKLDYLPRWVETRVHGSAVD